MLSVEYKGLYISILNPGTARRTVCFKKTCVCLTLNVIRVIVEFGKVRWRLRCIVGIGAAGGIAMMLPPAQVALRSTVPHICIL